jgi:acyl-CoA dehydrogenase
MYLPQDETDPLGAIEMALHATLAAEPIEARMRDAARTGKIASARGDERLAAARAAGIISEDDAMVIRRAQRLTEIVIRVDDFPQDLGVAEMRPQDASPSRPATSVRKAAA